MLWSNFNTGLNLIFLFFFSFFMYDNEFETMGNKPQHIHTIRDLGDSSNLIGSLSRTLTLYLPANSGVRSTYLPRLQRKIVQFEMNHILN